MRTVIIHGKKISTESPRAGRPACALWGVTRANAKFWGGKLLDWTEWVDVHPLVQNANFPGIPERRPDGWRWMLQQDGTRPIWLMAPEAHPPAVQAEAFRRFAQVPGARRFPIREIQRAFPINGEPNRWFVEQAGMMIAKAAHEGYQHIILNGIGAQTGYEFERAHRSILYWLAFARGRGIRVTIEGPSIYHTPSQIYAYEKFNYDELEEARAERRERERRPDHEAMAQANADQRRRGRPDKFRLPPELDA